MRTKFQYVERVVNQRMTSWMKDVEIIQLKILIMKTEWFETKSAEWFETKSER